MKKNYSPVLFMLYFTTLFLNSLNAHQILKNSVFPNLDYLNRNYKDETEIERHRLWLNLTNNEGLFKQLLIGYVEGATDGYDYNYDAVSVDANKYADFFSINEGKKLVIQGRGLPFDSQDTVPLGYRSAIEGDLIISIDKVDGALVDQDIYIEDRQTGIVHNLKKGIYTFTTQKGTFLNRFIIRYSAKANLAIPEFSAKDTHLTIFSNNNIITLKSSGALMEKVLVFDVTGGLIYKSPKVDAFDLDLDDIQARNQLLLFKVTFEGGVNMVKKIIF